MRLSASQTGDGVELHVADEGEGFPPEFLEEAFERFSRADHARTLRGSGLGLSIVQVIAEAHGGSAQVANRDRGGADAWLLLPSADQLEEPTQATQSRTPRTSVGPVASPGR